MLTFSPSVASRLRESDCRIVVTGAGGWLGNATLEMLDQTFGGDFDTRVTAYASATRQVELRSGRLITLQPLENLATVPPAPSYVFHYAYLGKEKVAEFGAERFTETNRRINDLVYEYCGRVPSGGMYFASSGAARYADGSVDAAREPYGAAKVRDEQRFLQLNRNGFPAAACRIFSMAGPHINKLAEYVLSCILLDIQRGGPIRLRATRRVFRSFVHVRQVVDVAAAVATQGLAANEIFDAAGDEVVEVGDLAARAAQVLDCPGITIERPPVSVLSDDRYVGDGGRFDELLKGMGQNPIPLDRQIRDTAEYLASLCPRTS